MNEGIRVGIIGLGYVGLPLAVEFAKQYHVVGLDINESRIKELKKGHDCTLEVESKDLLEVVVDSKDEKGLYFSSEISELSDVNFFIITVPTPIDSNKKPDLSPLYGASKAVGSVLSEGDIVVYESTVYPGVTEDECIPILEDISGLKFNEDFFAGYSPERINPGDKERTVTKILKVTSGSTPEIATKIDDLYASVITAGTFKASSIKVAEAAKVIENSQRDINIAFVNELSKIFHLMDIDTQDVLEAAGTKWNFLPFKPGLVGGHCIGVDPYYLAEKSIELGYNPEIILSGRRLNDSMGPHVATETVKAMVKKDIPVKGANILVLGIAFKENCPDIRNSRVIDIINELQTYDLNIDVYDPWADEVEVKDEYGVDLITKEDAILETYDALVLAVAHKEFITFDIDKYLNKKNVVFDVKSVLPKSKADMRL